MKSTLLSFLMLFVLFSCNKDEEIQTAEAEFAVSGKFLAPNDTDPIPNAKVSAYVNNELVNQTLTDAEGKFTIPLNRGDFHLVLNKGKFKTEKDITVEGDMTLESYKIETFPNIGVVTGSYDNIESVLYSIGLFNPVTGDPLFDIIEGNAFTRMANAGHKHDLHSSHQANRTQNNPLLNPNTSFHFGDLMADPALLASYDIIFLNCGLNESLESNSSVLTDYVNNGGILYATDWAAGYLEDITNSGANYITPLDPEKSGNSLTTTATILDGTLSDWLLLNFGISVDDTVVIDEFLPAWQVVDSYDSATTISWLSGEVNYDDATNTAVTATKDLAFTFIHGNGAVLYSSFHTENNEADFSDVDRIMEFLVFEMSDIE